MDCSPSGSSDHGISQARVLEWVAISFSRGSFQSRDRTQSPALQADSLLSERLMKPNSYAVSLFPAISLLLKLIWQMKFKCKTNPNRHILITSNTQCNSIIFHMYKKEMYQLSKFMKNNLINTILNLLKFTKVDTTESSAMLTSTLSRHSKCLSSQSL